MRIAVIDSSPLIQLAHLNLCRELALFFDVVYVPRAVQREVNLKHRFRYQLNRLFRSGFFVRCIAADATNIRLLRDEIDEGEAEALIQAQENAAPFFIGDEKRAREISENMGIVPVGTVRLLARLSLEGRAADTRTLVHKLQDDLGFRISQEVVETAIANADKPI